MTTSEQLCHIMTTQAELMDAITEILGDTQQALLHSDGPALERCTQREEELLRPFNDLESERLRCVVELKPGSESVKDVVAFLTLPERATVNRLAERMQQSAKSILDLNTQNTALLTNAQRFVQETLRIVTDGNRRKLVDERI